MSEKTDLLVLPEGIGAPLTTEVARYGAMDVETGGFFLAPEADPLRVTALAVAGERGITRRRGLFHVSGKAIDRLFGWADGQGFRIPAQFHSHGEEAFLSKTDRLDGFNVTDFISAVVPHYLKPPSDPRSWGWWIFDGDEWITLPPPETVGAGVRVVVFDEDGVRAHE
jgi:hypothetical protein